MHLYSSICDMDLLTSSLLTFEVIFFHPSIYQSYIPIKKGDQDEAFRVEEDFS